MSEKSSREIALEEALKAAEDVISYYECEHDRSNYDDEDLPEELLEAEEALEKAKAKLKG